ncbi:unnamed protein product, partial [Prorocentrum cordatum]
MVLQELRGPSTIPVVEPRRLEGVRQVQARQGAGLQGVLVFLKQQSDLGKFGYWGDCVQANKKLAAQARGGEDVPMEPAEVGDATDAAAKNRLQEVDELIQRLKGIEEPAVVETRTTLLAEQAELRAEVAASRPLGQRLRELGAQFTKQQKLRDGQQRRLDGLQAQIRELQEKERATLDKLAALDASMEELGLERKKLQGQVPTPDERPAVDEPIKGVNATLEGRLPRGVLFQSLGAERQLAGRLTASLEELRQLDGQEKEKKAAEKEREAAEKQAEDAPGAADAQDPEFLAEVVAAGGEKHELE